MRRESPARRRRTASRVPALLGAATYAGLLAVVIAWPGWHHLPVLTSAAGPAMDLLLVSLALCLLGCVLTAAGADPRLRAGVTYVVALVNLAVLGRLWDAFPFDFGASPEAWATTARWVLAALAVWAVAVALRAAVVIVRGRRIPRLAM